MNIGNTTKNKSKKAKKQKNKFKQNTQKKQSNFKKGPSFQINIFVHYHIIF